MRRLVLILIAFIAVITFVKAFENTKVETSKIENTNISDFQKLSNYRIDMSN